MAFARDWPVGRAALLVIDMIDDLNFPGEAIGGGADHPFARRGRRSSSTTISANGIPRRRDWWIRLRADGPVRDIVEALRPAIEGHFVIKPQFFGVYATNLPVLLHGPGVRRLILTGMATDIRVLFTAVAAHMRDHAPWVPEDAVAATHCERPR